MNRTVKNILLSPMNILYRISPKLELQLMFYLKLGYKLNLNNPKTYNEKLNWMKLYYRNDLMPQCVDKFTVRQYVKDCGCEELLNELLWEGGNAKDIPFEELPERFVIKVTHGSGNNIICKDKSKLDKESTIQKLNKWLEEKYIPCYGEWFYGIVKPRIIVEEFLSEDGDEVPADYKMFCFNDIENGHGVGLTALDTDRFINHKRTIYDADWNMLKDVTFDFPNDIENECEKPEVYEKMIEYAKKLSKPFPHARIDFYVINNKIYLGEITFTNGAGFDRISPHSFDEKMGSWIKLPV